MNNRIYQSPDVYTVVSNRLVSTQISLPEANESKPFTSSHHFTPCNLLWTYYGPTGQTTRLEQDLSGP